jgi:hypothetical protein
VLYCAMVFWSSSHSHREVDALIRGLGRSVSAATGAVLQVDASSAAPGFLIAPTASVPSQLNRDDARFVEGVSIGGTPRRYKGERVHNT